MDPNMVPSAKATCKPLLTCVTGPGDTDRDRKNSKNQKEVLNLRCSNEDLTGRHHAPGISMKLAAAATIVEDTQPRNELPFVGLGLTVTLALVSGMVNNLSDLSNAVGIQHRFLLLPTSGIVHLGVVYIRLKTHRAFFSKRRYQDRGIEFSPQEVLPPKVPRSVSLRKVSLQVP